MLDGFVYAVGGWEGRSRLDSVECYNPHTNSWQFTESFKMAVTSPAVVALDGLLYVTGRTRLLFLRVCDRKGIENTKNSVVISW